MSDVEKAQKYTFEQWLQSYPNPKTRACYYTGARSFLQSIYQTDDKVENLASHYVKETEAGKRDYFQDDQVHREGERLPANRDCYMDPVEHQRRLCHVHIRRQHLCFE
jgi:hypothetical protein